MAGPQVKGIEQKASKHPMACDAPAVPTISKAMGPSREMKQPSNRPMNNAITMKKGMALAAVISIVRVPMQKKDICNR